MPDPRTSAETLSGPGFAVGRLLYFVRRAAAGTEMLSRFWLGEVATGSLVLDTLANTRFVRRLLPEAAGVNLLRHRSEEMNHLAVPARASCEIWH